MPNTYKVVYCDLKNFGDQLNKYIINKKGNNCIVDIKKSNTSYYLFIGSLIQPEYCNKNAIICGAGYFLKNKTVELKEIKYVRGKYTRNKLIEQGYECPEIYGDPGLIISKIYNPNTEIRKIISFTPHIYEIDLYLKMNKYNTIDFRTFDVEKVLNEIITSKYIISSSLHGIITAHSYGKKAIWVNMFGNRILHGDSTKFYDYYSSLGIDKIEPLKIEDILKLNVNDLLDLIEKYPNPNNETIIKIQQDIIDNTPFIKL